MYYVVRTVVPLTSLDIDFKIENDGECEDVYDNMLGSRKSNQKAEHHHARKRLLDIGDEESFI